MSELNNEDRRVAAAARCAELSNAVSEAEDNLYTADYFLEARSIIDTAFRREIERIHARDREVLKCISLCRYESAIDLLRADLLPEPAPTLLEEYEKGRVAPCGLDHQQKALVADVLDWIAKRGVEVKPKGEDV